MPRKPVQLAGAWRRAVAELHLQAPETVPKAEQVVGGLLGIAILQLAAPCTGLDKGNEAFPHPTWSSGEKPRAVARFNLRHLSYQALERQRVGLREETEKAFAETGEGLSYRLIDVALRSQVGDDAFGLDLDHGREQFGLVVEVAVQGGARYACLRDHVIQGDGVRSPAEEEVASGDEEGLPLGGVPWPSRGLLDRFSRHDHRLGHRQRPCELNRD